MTRSPEPGRAVTPPRYLLVVPWELSFPGGVNQVVGNLYDRLAARPGLRPWVLVKAWQPAGGPGRTDGRRTLRMRLRDPFPAPGGWKARLLAWLTLPQRTLGLGWWLRRRRVAAVNAHYPGLWLLPVALAGWLGVWRGRLVLSVHGQDLREARQWTGARRWWWVWLCRRASAIAACSEALAEEVRADLPGLADRVQAVPNGVDPDRIQATATPPTGTDSPLPSGRDYLACVATFEHKKGQDGLLRAFAGLASDYPDLDLVLAGRRAGEWEPYRELAAELGLAQRVHFLPDLAHGEALGVIRGARLFVLPSRYEPFGIVLLEAGVLGVPVVASRVGGIPQVVRDGVDGLLVPPADAAALETGLRTLLADPQWARRLAGSLHSRVLGEFSWERTAERYQDLAGAAPPEADLNGRKTVGWRRT